MNNNISKLNNEIIKCKLCPRLKKFRDKIVKNKRKQFKNEKYWGKPITGFGDTNAQILFIGLAPAAHGGTRTGRVFTGDKSSEFLYSLCAVVIITTYNSDSKTLSIFSSTRRPNSSQNLP